MLSLGFSSILSAQNYAQVAKLVASDRDEEANYGKSVSISGNYAVSGAIAEDFDANASNYIEDAGAAYIIEKSGNNWQEVKKLVASDRASMDYFGSSVSISGNYIIVGAWGEDEDASGGNTMSQAGSAYIFERIGGTWVEVQKIVPSDRTFSDRFGRSVAISGDYAIVGNDQHTVYFFERSSSGEWNEVYWLHSNSGDYFGYSVSISGNTALVGAIRNSYDENDGDFEHYAGAAYFITRDGSGNWTVGQKIVASDRYDGDHFGNAVAVNGNRAIVGAHFNGEDQFGQIVGLHSGAAYIFELAGNTWSQAQKVVAPDGTDGDEFGISVAIQGDYALVGLEVESYEAPSPFEPGIGSAGAAYLFDRNTSGVWTYPQMLSASDKSSGDHFGNSVAISGEHIIVGAIWDGHDAAGQNNAPSAGSAYIFEPSSVGIAEVMRNKSVQIFPNPSDGHFAITSQENLSPGANLSLLNMMGQEVYQVELEAMTQGASVTVDAFTLPSGIYLCTIQSEEISVQQRIVIEH